MMVYVALFGYSNESIIVGVFTTASKADQAAKRALEHYKSKWGSDPYVKYFCPIVQPRLLDSFHENAWLSDA